MGPMSDAYFFGYGSLVNRKTHAYCDVHRAHLRGWRRVWRQTHLRNLAFLSVEPAPDVAIDGLIAAVPGADWDALDEREMAYHRSPISDGLTHPGPDTARVEIYQVSPQNMTDGAHPILLSYLDVVVQGYLAEFGADGVAAFFETTAGWDIPIMDDRSAPFYPRHQQLGSAERDLVDAALNRIGAEVRPSAWFATVP